MKIPDEFKVIFGRFGQHVRYCYDSIEDAAVWVVVGLKLNENVAAKAYFDDLTSGKYTEEELSNLWLYSGAEVGVRKNQTMLGFLTYFRGLMNDDHSKSLPPLR